MTNLRALQSANALYQSQNGGRYVAGAERMVSENLKRWCGQRESTHEPFDYQRSPLRSYVTGQARACPEFDDYIQAGPEAFEAACGGYGYNNVYVGMDITLADARKPDWGKYEQYTLRGNLSTRFANPGRTVAFADSALVNGGLIQYSFCEPPVFLGADPAAAPTSDPSTHFRHLGRANVVWLDGGGSSVEMSYSKPSPSYYEGEPEDYDVGFFGPRSNELFDLE
jgi:prepilin-type processing-associated H-X9-DG protein